MSTTELFLLTMLIIYAFPYLVWRLCNRDDYLPLVVVQILAGIALGPGALGALQPHLYQAVFRAPVIQSLNGVAWLAVMLFVWLAGLELDLMQTWRHRRETALTAGLALGLPMLAGAAVALVLLALPGWIGPAAQPWQFVAGIGMACAVTALPILVLFLEKLDVLRTTLGQRILRYASLDDILIWAVLALILMDWRRLGWQVLFLAGLSCLAVALRRLMQALPMPDRWPVALITVLLLAFAADWSGLHFMVGSFLAGVVMRADWFGQAQLDRFRQGVLLALMPVFFLSTGLRTQWTLGGVEVVLAALALLAAAVAGKLLGVRLAGRLLGWSAGESRLIGWLLQTKALIMIIFVNVLLDRQIISDDAFTALLLMAVGSTVLSLPFARPALQDLGHPKAAGTAPDAIS